MTGFAPLTRAAGEALEPLELALSDRRACERLLAQVGRHVSVSPDTFERVRELLPLAELLESLEPDAELDEVVAAVAEAVNAIRALSELDAAELEGLPGSLADPAAWVDLAAALPEVLLAGWLSRNQPALHALMRLTGICTLESSSGRTTRERFRWDALGAVLADPATALRETVAWDGEFAAWPLQRELGLALGRVGLPVRVRPRSRPVAEALAGQAVEVPTGAESDVVLFSGANGDGAVEAGIVFACSTDGGPTVYIGNQAYGAFTEPLALSDSWTLEAAGDIAGSGTIGARLRPTGMELVGGSAGLGTSLALVGRPPGGTWNLLGESGGTRVELDGVTIELGLAGTASEPEAYLLARVDDGGLRIALDLGGADSFLRGALGEGPVIEAGGQLRFGSRSGLAFEGGLGLSVTLPVERQVGPFYIASVTIELGASGDGVRFAATTVADVTLGPVVGSVTDVGAALLLAPDTGGDGLAGLAGALEFVPPDGLGLGVDVAGIVSGGGFLDLDPEIGRYAGVGELDVLGVGLVATGILDTQVPSSPLGWSLFLSLAARFPVVQLGFGFTLNGVGGLVGIERGLDDDALGEAVRSGSLDAILFPENAIADAALILSEIDSIFPSAAGQYVFGPIVKVGWGTPTVVELDAGVAIQLPDPLTVSLLGALSAVLPREDTPILELHVNFAGTINLTEGTLKVDASLTGSQVAGLLVTGDMAVRTAFLDNPTFLVAFGGFHPAFDPPADFPDLDKVGVALDTGDALRVTLGGYFALTSNSVQVGARADLWAGGDGFTIEGGTSFNALITFEPFSFSIGMRVWVSVTAGGFELLGVLLSGKLSGPNPWKVHGVAEFRLLGVKTRFSVDESFGELANEGPPEQADPAQLVQAALGLEDAWTAVPPTGPSPVVLGANAADGALHPSGRVQVLQRLLPLDVEIACYGAAELVGEDIVSVDAVGFAAGDVEDAVDWFASAQYFLLSEDEKLTAPSFAQMKAGLVMGGSGADAPAAAEAVFDHEIGYRDPLGRAKGAAAGVTVVAGRDETMTRALGARTTSTPKLRYSIAEPLWTVANPDTARSTGAVPAAGTGFYSARTAMAKRPGTPAVLVPAYEAELIG